jgi:streptogramin lyase
MHPTRLAAATAALALGGSLAASSLGTASAADPSRQAPTVTTIAKPYLSPLSVAQSPDGTRYWTDNFAGLLYRQSPGGAPQVVFTGAKKQSVESVSADGGVLRFTTGAMDNSAGRLMTLDAAGGAVQLADLHAYEKAVNPDRKFRYGFLGAPKSCTDLLAPTSPGASYRGVVESHPYATASANGVTYVADAGANAVFAVSATGAVSTVAVIEPAKVKITRKIQKQADLPSCLVGRRLSLESVPTDVEVGPGNQLYVSNLSGGPEDGRFGSNGAVSRIDLATGAVSKVVDGLASPVGVAVSPTGDVYVADLFPGAIAEVAAGTSTLTTYAEVPFPGAVEWTPTGLLATATSLPGKKPKGQIVSITP